MEEFENTENKRKLLMQQLLSLEERELMGDISGEDLERKKAVVDELEKITLMEEILWRQKSRVLWLKEGDECSKFFHCMANFHRRIMQLRLFMMVITSFQIKRSLRITL